MNAAPLRFLNAAAWPLTIWTSLSQFGNHPADDYVERTFPIVATAIGFWVCVAAMVYLSINGSGGGGVISAADGEVAVRFVHRGVGVLGGVLAVFTPVIYLIGLWLFSARAERFPN